LPNPGVFKPIKFAHDEFASEWLARRQYDGCTFLEYSLVLLVSFNVEDAYQFQLLQYVQAWTNFSGTVKRFIGAQMHDNQVAVLFPSISTNLAKVHEIIPDQANREVVALDDYDPVSDIFGTP
jgi:hypothetical protein